jgi:hypothetical protein
VTAELGGKDQPDSPIAPFSQQFPRQDRQRKDGSRPRRALIEQRRIAAGMTHAQLAARADPGAVTGPPRLCTDNDHDAVPLGLLERLCQVLDLHPARTVNSSVAAATFRALPTAT